MGNGCEECCDDADRCEGFSGPCPVYQGGCRWNSNHGLHLRRQLRLSEAVKPPIRSWKLRQKFGKRDSLTYLGNDVRHILQTSKQMLLAFSSLCYSVVATVFFPCHGQHILSPLVNVHHSSQEACTAPVNAPPIALFHYFLELFSMNEEVPSCFKLNLIGHRLVHNEKLS